jgi:hypothetical protein
MVFRDKIVFHALGAHTSTTQTTDVVFLKFTP